MSCLSNIFQRLLYGTPEGTFSVFFLSCTHKLLTRFDNIITRLNDLLCRLNKLFILFKQDSNSFKRLIMSFKQDNNSFKQDNNSFIRLIMSFKQVINLGLYKIITCVNDLLCRLNKLFILFKRLIIGVTTYRNEPERTEQDQN